MHHGFCMCGILEFYTKNTCFFNAKIVLLETADRCCQSGVDLTVLMEQFLDGPEVDVDVT